MPKIYYFRVDGSLYAFAAYNKQIAWASAIAYFDSKVSKIEFDSEYEIDIIKGKYGNEVPFIVDSSACLRTLCIGNEDVGNFLIQILLRPEDNDIKKSRFNLSIDL